MCPKCKKPLKAPSWKTPNARFSIQACENKHLCLVASKGPAVSATAQEQDEWMKLARKALFGT